MLFQPRRRGSLARAAWGLPVETKPGAQAYFTVSLAQPRTHTALASIMTFPAAMARPTPGLLASLLICATAGFDELHVTEASCCVVPSLNLPMAINRCVAPGDKMDVAGVMAIDSRPGGRHKAGSYSSALAVIEEYPVQPPAISTMSLSSSVAV